MKLTALLPSLVAIFVLGADHLAFAVQPKKPLQPAEKTFVSPPVPSKWQVFKSPEGRFTVLMPGAPKKLAETQKTFMGEIHFQQFVAEPPNQRVAYVVVYNDFPDSYGQEANMEKILDDARNLAIKATRSNLVKEQKINVNGLSGRELEYTKGNSITRCRMYLVNGRLYQVNVHTTRKQEKFLTQSIAGFLNSFKVPLKQ